MFYVSDTQMKLFCYRYYIQTWAAKARNHKIKSLIADEI